MRQCSIRYEALVWIFGIGMVFWILSSIPALAEVAAPAPEASGPEFGLFRVASQSPFQSLRMSMTPHTPDVLAQGQWRLDFGQRFSNVWIHEAPRYFLDYEMSESALRAGYGITRNVTAEVCLESRRIYGGFLDGVIASFHDTFGLDQDGRDKAPSGQTNIRILDGGGNTLYARSGSDALYQGISMSFHHRLMEEEGPYMPAFGYGLTVGADLGNPEDIDRDAPLDVGISAALSKKFGNWSGYLFGALAWYGSDQVQEVELKKMAASGLVGLQWLFRPDMALVLQYLVTDGAAENLEAFSDPVHEVVLGWQGRLWPRVMMEVGLIENIFFYDNSVDFGLHAGISVAL